MTALSFSTDNAPPGQAFDYWWELGRSRIFGFTLELDPARRAGFDGFHSIDIAANAALMTTKSAALQATRGRGDIARMPAGAVLVYQQGKGAAWFDSGGERFETSPGSFAVGDLDVPFQTATVADTRHNFRAIALPYALFDEVSAPPISAAMRPATGGAGVNALFAAYFDAFCRQLGGLAGAEIEPALRILARLLMLARDPAAPRDDLAHLGVREARLEMARQYMARNFTDPRLDPAMVAAALGVSIRQLHQLFEPTGTSFARYLTMLRLEQARQLLQQERGTIINVALTSGFDSIATFNRSFRRSFGLSPTELRRAIGMRGD